MDPEETLRLAEEAIDVGDYDVALDHLNEYRSWRDNGGFEPPDGDLFEEDMRTYIKELQRKTINTKQLKNKLLR